MFYFTLFITRLVSVFSSLGSLALWCFYYLLQDATDDEGLKDDEESASKDEKNEEEGKGKKEVLT